MKRIALASLIALFCAASAQAACYADYKAKQDDPLRLHYGVIELDGECSEAAAGREIAERLDGTGWQLLNVVSVFGDEGLEDKKDSAGDFYLRY